MAQNISLTNYGNGITSFGIPVMGTGGSNIPVSGGSYFFVHSGRGADGNVGDYNSPLATIDAAIGRCTAAQGDVIVVLPGHAETISAAGGITADISGISIYGLGEEDDRPIITFSATASTFLVTAANVTLANLVLVPSIDSVVSAIVVSAAGATIGLPGQPIVAQDASASIEFVRALLTTAAANNLNVNLQYRGFTAGNAVVNAIRLVGADNFNIMVDFYGVASTAIVEFITTACTNGTIGGYFYNSGTTDLSKNVVDTVTASTWFCSGYDGAAGCGFSGGSGAALAKDDISVVVAGMAVPSADSTANALERDVVGNKTDAAVGAASATASLVAYAKGLLADNLALPRCVEKSDGAIISGTDALFTITGGPIQVLQIIGIVTTAIGAGTTNVKLTTTTTEPAATVDMNAAAVDIDADAAGTSYRSINTTAIFTPVTAGFVMEGNAFATNDTQFLVPIGSIGLNSDAARTGNIKWYLRYVPLSPLSRVAAAA
jgi:hypothetical protein